MAKKKTPQKKKRANSPVAAGAGRGKVPNVSKSRSKKKKVTSGPNRKSKPKTSTTNRAKPKERLKMSDVALLPAADEPQILIPPKNRDSLTAWLALYMKIDGEACAEQTRLAKTQDLDRFLDYFTTVVPTDDKTRWTRTISEGFQRELKKARSERTGRKLAPATINRVFATLRTAAKWIHGHSPFPAGNPMDRISDLTTPEPTWQGLTDVQMVRMKEAADQMLTLATAANQWPKRDYALFHVLHVTAMRVSELIGLDIDQYDGRYLVNVQRKGKTVTPKMFLVKAARTYLDGYLDAERGRKPGPLFQTRTEKRFSIQQVDYLLKKLAGLANATLPAKEHIDVHPHILRHTMLRKVREEKGLEYAIEYAGHVSEKYIRRYTMPSEQETEAALEELFG